VLVKKEGRLPRPPRYIPYLTCKPSLGFTLTLTTVGITAFWGNHRCICVSVADTELWKISSHINGSRGSILPCNSPVKKYRKHRGKNNHLSNKV